MDLVLTKNKKTNSIIQIGMMMSSFILSMTMIDHTSIVFVLPLMMVAFCSQYINLVICLFFSTIGLIITNQIFTLIVLYSFVCILFVLNIFKLLKTKDLPIFLSLLLIPFFYMNDYTIFQIIYYVIVNYLNCLFYLQLMPLFMHHNKELYTHKRLIILSLIIETMILSLLRYNTTYCMILLRYYLLISIYYLSIDAIMPTLLYISLIMIFISPTLKDDVLSLILPMSIFFWKQPKNKYFYASLFLISHIILPFFITYEYDYYTFVIVIPTLLFILSPKLKTHTSLNVDEFKEITKHNQLQNKANAFANLFKQLTDIFQENHRQTNVSEYIGYVYEDVCCHCTSKDYCFYQKDGLSRLGKLMSKGMIEEFNQQDRDYILCHCLKPEDYLLSIEQHKRSYLKMEKVNETNYHMKKELFEELSIMSHVFENFSKTVEPKEDEQHIFEHLKAYQFDIIYVKRNRKDSQNYVLELGIEDIDKKTINEELIPILQSYTGHTLDLVDVKNNHKYLGYTSIILKHELRYTLQISQQQYSLDQQNCGDSTTSFEHGHHQYIALSDGMGQGYLANKESQMTLHILSELLKNDISLKDTLNSINALLKIKNQGDMYTTLDLIDFNQMKANMKVIKYGACNSYLISHHHIETISCHALPVGMSGRQNILTYDFKLKEGDIIIMMSDGVSGDIENTLNKNINHFDSMTAYEISSFLFHKSCIHQTLDDTTLLVMKVISKN